MAKRRAAASVLVLVALSVIGGAAYAGAALADAGCASTVLTVTVGPTDANTPGNGPGSGCGSIAGGGSDAGGGSTPPPGTVLSPTPALSVSANPPASPMLSPTPKPGEADLGGILYLSGLGSKYLWSVNPAESVVVLRITLRNVSKSTFDSTARFWMDTSLGNTVSEIKEIPIIGLRPNETRIVAATMAGLGQWTVLQAHATIRPPKSVDGVALAPITRDTYVFIPPLLAGGIGAFGVGAFFVGKSLLALRLAARARGIL